MFNFHSTFIVILGIILSFLLCTQGERYNFESTEYGLIVEDCEEKEERGFYCEYRFLNREQELIEKFGAAYGNLAYGLKIQKVFVIIPILILIISLFVSFTLDAKEVLFSVLVLSPLFLTFLLKFFLGAEFCLTPFYLLYAVGLTTLFSRIKRFLFIKNP